MSTGIEPSDAIRYLDYIDRLVKIIDAVEDAANQTHPK